MYVKNKLPGAGTRDPTHDKVMREKNLTGKVDQVFRDSEKLPPKRSP